MSFLSVVVATYNRAVTLQTTLERLANQTLSKDLYEVIVVDDGSPDNTTEIVERYAKQSAYPLTYLRHENRGPGYSENRGIRQARGPWILLIADDIFPEPEMLKAHFDAHVAHPEANVAIAGKVVQSPDLPPTVFLKNWDPFRYSKFEAFEELSYLNFWACNVSLKKEFVVQHGMFLERRAAAHEDTELGWRLYRDGGLKLLYLKSALALHYHPENIDSACRRAYERGINFDVLCDSVKDPGLYVRTHIVTLKTLRCFFADRRNFVGQVVEEDESVTWFLIREGIRRVVFNRLTVPVVIVPMIRAAERNRMFAALVTPMLIRGAVSYYFLQGLKELRRRRRADPSSPAPLPI